MNEIHEPGIYFGMHESEYHADPSFSHSGIKDILVSPLDYWMRSTHNPDRKDSDTDAKRLGRAYHKRIAEGRDAFLELYAVTPEPDDYPGLLKTGEELRAECKARGLKASGTLGEMSARIREVDADVPLWTEIMEAFERDEGHKELISRTAYLDLERAAFVIERTESVVNAFRGGMPEVSIFWREGDIPMKARIDYLKPGLIVDLKSFANIMQKPLVMAAAHEIARNRYYIQPPTYRRGLTTVLEMVRNGTAMADGPVDKEWLASLLSGGQARFVFVFQQTGDVPNVIARFFSERETHGGNGLTFNEYWKLGEAAFAEGTRLYRRCMNEYGPDQPWVVDYGVRRFVDEDFPLYMLDSVKIMEDAA